MTEKLPWLRELITFGGAITGIVLTAVGGVMLINATLKLYVFQFQSEEYQVVTIDECRYDHNRTKPVAAGEISKPYERTPEEVEQCKADRQEENRLRFERNKKENMVDGLAMLLVGIPFWIIFERRRKAKK